ncbi:MAG TPA: hypothetical protein VNG29_00305 [Candidatus Paceibacterota bacterium]|nr:hypothetical protein [Candidatus Paceibacterota bacterium]
MASPKFSFSRPSLAIFAGVFACFVGLGIFALTPTVILFLPIDISGALVSLPLLFGGDLPFFALYCAVFAAIGVTVGLMFTEKRKGYRA